MGINSHRLNVIQHNKRTKGFEMKYIISMILLTLVSFGCATNTPSGVKVIQNFEVDRYLGTWYEIARLDHSFERGMSNVTAQYSFNDDGTIRVLNTGFKDATNKWDSAEGKAKFKGKKNEGSLKVSFFGPFYGGYHIIELSKDYEYVMIAGPSKNYLWILSRDPKLDETTYNRLVEKAKNLGFPTHELIEVKHNKIQKS